MDMATKALPLELKEGVPYYIAGFGVYNFTGQSDRTQIKNDPKLKLSFSKYVFHFKAHGVYGEIPGVSTERTITDTAIFQNDKHSKVFEFPSRSDLGDALTTILERPDAQNPGQALYKLESEDILSLGEVLRDSRATSQQHVKTRAIKVLANVLAFAVQSEPAQAENYIKSMIDYGPWPLSLWAMPRDKEAMVEITEMRRARTPITPEKVEELMRDPEQKIQLMPAEGKTSVENNLSADRPARKSIRRDRVNMTECFQTHSVLYGMMSKELSGTPAMKLIDAAVGRKTESDIYYLSKILLSQGPLDIYFIAKTFRDDRNSGKEDWSPNLVRDYYNGLFEELTAHLSETEKVEVQSTLDFMRDRIGKGTSEKKKSRPASEQFATAVAAVAVPVVPITEAFAALLQAKADPAAAPTPTIATASEVVEEIPAPVLPQVSTQAPAEPIKKEADDPGTVSVTYNLNICQQPTDVLTRDLQEVFETLPLMKGVEPVQIMAMRTLSPQAMVIFSKMALAEKPVSAEEMGRQINMSPGTVRQIFSKATQLVQNKFIEVIYGLSQRPEGPA